MSKVVTHNPEFATSFIIDALDLHAFPAACCHGSLIHAPGGELLSQASIDPEVVVGIAEKLRNANKTVLLYRATDVAMVSKESGSNTDWEQVSRGFDPMVVDQRDTDFLERVKKGEAVVSKTLWIVLCDPGAECKRYRSVKSSCLWTRNAWRAG